VLHLARQPGGLDQRAVHRARQDDGRVARLFRSAAVAPRQAAEAEGVGGDAARHLGAAADAGLSAPARLTRACPGENLPCTRCGVDSGSPTKDTRQREKEQDMAAMEKTVKVPGPDHPITIAPNPARVVVSVAGRVVADTRAALTLREGAYKPVQYIPRADVDMS